MVNTVIKYAYIPHKLCYMLLLLCALIHVPSFLMVLSEISLIHVFKN